MYLKKLELNGFKSFAQPTNLEFSSGITAIVGPNGSGKSNLADAVRWILGEQSMKSIRSQKSKDLIFSGSKNKSRLGKARVCLHFDNQSGRLPVDYSEVQITRNIFRDGTSEYFINNSSSRLTDVVEILAKANIGHRGFSVINQGMESEILKYSPKELYELLEEASGVRYLQLKKRRAERRLKSTQTNLEKISTVLTELKPRLRYLKKEATKSERKEKLKKRLHQIQKQFFFLKLNALETEKKELQQNKQMLEKKRSTLKTEIEKMDKQVQEKQSQIEKNRSSFIHAQEELENILNQRLELNDQLASVRAKIQSEASKEKQAPKSSKQESLNLEQAQKIFKRMHVTLKQVLSLEDLNKVKKKITEILNQIEKITGLKDTQKRSNSSTSSQTQKISQQLSKLKKKETELAKLLTELDERYNDQKDILKNSREKEDQEKFFELERSLRRKKDKLYDFENQLREINWSWERITENCQQIDKQIESAEIDKQEIKNMNPEKIADKSLEELEEKINRYGYKIGEIGEVDDLVLKEYRETDERYTKLTKRVEDLKQAKKDLEKLIKQLTQKITLQFEENFQVINKSFNNYVRLLFGGGKGHLKQITNRHFPGSSEQQEDQHEEELEEEEQQPESASKGIEINAHLPGKKIKDLRMFSGGEKALTSIALLFAIINSNPPPFLVLDEVDATLDESNSQRFAKLLNEFREDTQFIVITHNRETMNQSDMLYGVAMSDDGVSRLLSLNLEK